MRAAWSPRAAAERDTLIGELTRALGLGGRSRRLGDDTERVRKAVTARIHHAIDRIQHHTPTWPPTSCNHPTAGSARHDADASGRIA